MYGRIERKRRVVPDLGVDRRGIGLTALPPFDQARQVDRRAAGRIILVSRPPRQRRERRLKARAVLQQRLERAVVERHEHGHAWRARFAAQEDRPLRRGQSGGDLRDQHGVALQRHEKTRVGQILAPGDEGFVFASAGRLLDLALGVEIADPCPDGVIVPPARAGLVDAHAHQEVVQLAQLFARRLPRQPHRAAYQPQHAGLSRRVHATANYELRRIAPCLERAFKTKKERVRGLIIAGAHVQVFLPLPAVTLSNTAFTTVSSDRKT